MTVRIHPFVIDGITRPCANCDSVNIHWDGDQCVGYVPSEFTTTTPAFDAVLAKARELGFPLYYTSDLFRNYQFLTGPDAPSEFLWAPEICGTHMIVLAGPTAWWGRAKEYGPVESLRQQDKAFGERQWFHWNRHYGMLIEVAPAKARELASDVEALRSRAA